MIWQRNHLLRLVAKLNVFAQFRPPRQHGATGTGPMTEMIFLVLRISLPARGCLQFSITPVRQRGVSSLNVCVRLSVVAATLRPAQCSDIESSNIYSGQTHRQLLAAACRALRDQICVESSGKLKQRSNFFINRRESYASFWDNFFRRGCWASD